MMQIVYLIIQVLSLVGLLSGILMFWSILKPQTENGDQTYPYVSIIIPARNEARRLPLLLESLRSQSWKHFEIIVVDDDSIDQTAEVASNYGAHVLKSKQVGTMSPGKANALAYGTRYSKGEWLLFLDADVVFENQDSLEKILSSFYKQKGYGILSIQPYHRIKKPYENLSAIFNIIVLTGMNVFTVWRDRFKTAGSFGPCILCDKESYQLTGGHEAAEESIMEDFALSDVFFAKNLPVTNYLGHKIINMRMYGEGMKQLFEGWTKNLATASQSTHRGVMVMIQLWILGVIMVTVAPLTTIITGSMEALISSAVIYLLYGTHTYILARRAGNFSLILLIFYPFFVLFFTTVFLYSIYRTRVLGSVMWRGRKIEL